MLQNVTPVDSGAVSCYHDRHNWPLRGMGQLIFLDCPEFRGDIRSSESRHVKGCPLGRHVGLPEYEKCPLTPSTSSTAPCARGSTPSSPPPRDPSSSAGPPARLVSPNALMFARRAASCGRPPPDRTALLRKMHPNSSSSARGIPQYAA